MILLFPALIHFKGNKEDMKNFAPTYVYISCMRERLTHTRDRCHIFYPQRVVDIPDGLPKWTGLNGKSELIEDIPGETKKRKRAELENQDEQEKQNGKNNEE